MANPTYSVDPPDHLPAWALSNFNFSTTKTANNGTTHHLITLFPTSFKTACFILAGVIATVNGSVIVAYVSSTRVRRTMSLFLLNLTVVDFQNGCVSLPLILLFPRTELEESPTGGVVVCILLVIWPKIFFIVAFQSVLVVTIERFICVVKPYGHSKLLGKQRCIAVIVGIWGFALCFSLMPILGYNRITLRGSLYMCDGTYQQGVVYLHVFLYGLLALPCALIMVLYFLMYRIARKHTRNIRKLHSNRSERKQLVQTSKAAKTVGLLSTFHMVCWLPFLVLLQVSELCKLGECPDTVSRENLQKATPPTIFLAFLGCALNPVLYIFRTRNIRTALVQQKLCHSLRRESLHYGASTRTSVCTEAGYVNRKERGYSMASLNSTLTSTNGSPKRYIIVPQNQDH